MLGLIPDCDLEQVSSAGNAAGTGARIALLNYESRQEIEEVVRQVEKVETAVEAKFKGENGEELNKFYRRFADLEKEMKLMKSQERGEELDKEKYKMLIAEYRKF